jgi:hypothetical protein
MLALEFLEFLSDPVPRALYIVGMRGGVERIVMKSANGILDMDDTNWQTRPTDNQKPKGHSRSGMKRLTAYHSVLLGDRESRK